MKRVMLTVAYDGTNYHGWQLQSNGISIEEVLNRCLTELLKEPVQVIGASRTDSGVHAFGNIAVFDTQARLPGDKFHPRKTDSVKTYEYRILNEEFPNPVKRLYSHFTYLPLDEKKMNEGAKFLIGEHDFKSFCSVNAQVESTVRTIYSCEVQREGTELVIRISGGGFLYNMVRIIAGTLMEVGNGKYPPEAVADILKAKERTAAGPTAPARGLTLISYEFPELKDSSERQEIL